VDRSVIPLCNSTNGFVQETIEQILISDNSVRLQIVGETNVAVRHCLVGKRKRNNDGDGEFSHIKSLHTHPQAWTQCTQFLDKHFGKEVHRIDENSTSAAAEFVANDEAGTSAAICSLLAAKLFGLDILAEDIQAENNNKTTFVIVRLRRQPSHYLHIEDFTSKPKIKLKSLRLIPVMVNNQRDKLSALISSYQNIFSIRYFNQKSQKPTIIEDWIFLFVEYLNDKEQAQEFEKLRTEIDAISSTSSPWGVWEETFLDEAGERGLQ